MKNIPSRLLLILILGVIYFISAKLGLKLAFVNASSTAVWPPTGIALAAFLIFGFKVWPAIFLGAFFANLTTAGNILTSLGIATGNTLEAVIGAFLINRFASGRFAFNEPQNIFKFAVIGGFLATTISATIGVVTLSLAGFANWSDFWNVWLTWWLGDLGGALIFAPLILVWSSNWKLEWNLKKAFEASCVFLVLAIALRIIFESAVSPFYFIFFPIFLWVSFRFSVRTAVTISFVYSLIAVWFTLHGYGPFVGRSVNESLLLLMAFLVVITITEAIIASVVTKSREVDRLKSEFISMASHELRTPMAAIKGLSAMILADRYGPVNEGLRVPLNNIALSIERLIALTTDLLDVSRLDSGKLEPELTDATSDSLIKEVVTELAPMAKLKGVEIKIDELDQKIVRVDLGFVREILHNLLGNAIKFTDQGSVTFSSVSNENMQQIFVADTGVGIPKPEQDKVFMKFFQVTSKDNKRPQGTGLGLYISQELTRKMGGSLRLAKSVPGEGTTFTLILPLSRSKLARGVSGT